MRGTGTNGVAIDVQQVPLERVVAAGLFDELDADLRKRYPEFPGALPHGVEVATFPRSGGVVMMAFAGSEAAGCGAFRPFDDTTVEIKRMFVRPAFRGRGIARAVLAALEAEARARGYSHVVLETGVRQPEALALYRSCGYRETPLFGEYIGDPHSVCFRKPL